MFSTLEKEYFLKAIEAFRRKVIVVSPEFKILAANCPESTRSGENLIGLCCHQVFYDRHLPCENCAVKIAKETGRPALRSKADFLEHDESVPCFYAYPILSEGKIEALVSMDFDLPTQGEIQKTLQGANALLRNLIMSAVDGVIAADKKGKIIIFNETASSIFGYGVKEALAELDIRKIYPEGVAYQVMRNLRSDDFGGKGKLRSFQVDVITKAGERVPISLNAAIVYENDREIATIGFFHDLSEIIRMKSELEKTQVQLLQAEKMASLGKLAAGVAHQLNNPIGGITLFTRLVMEEYELEDGARADLQRVLKDAERCRDTVKELLEFTRQTRHLMQPHDINRAISRTLFLLENQTLFHNIEIRKDLAPALPLVHSDIQQINHLFMNIILNAAQAMKGQGRLTITTTPSEDGRHVVIRISDTGSGIPPEYIPRIFDPFFTTKEEGQGTGLGLSLAYSIVENHGGVIRAENNPDGGASFFIELPVSPPKDSPESAAP